MKKTISILLAVLIVCSLSVSAFAIADPPISQAEAEVTPTYVGGGAAPAAAPAAEKAAEVADVASLEGDAATKGHLG